MVGGADPPGFDSASGARLLRLAVRSVLTIGVVFGVVVAAAGATSVALRYGAPSRSTASALSAALLGLALCGAGVVAVTLIAHYVRARRLLASAGSDWPRSFLSRARASHRWLRIGATGWLLALVVPFSALAGAAAATCATGVAYLAIVLLTGGWLRQVALLTRSAGALGASAKAQRAANEAAWLCRLLLATAAIAGPLALAAAAVLPATSGRTDIIGVLLGVAGGLFLPALGLELIGLKLAERDLARAARREGHGRRIPWPRTVDEAVDALLSLLPPYTRTELRNAPEARLPAWHHRLCMLIRRECGLWRGNRALLESCGQPNVDDASRAIIGALWQRLQDEEA